MLKTRVAYNERKLQEQQIATFDNVYCLKAKRSHLNFIKIIPEHINKTARAVS